MSVIQTDFDRIALLETDGWNHNSHYYNFLLRQVPADCKEALEIGCGTGSFSRLLAQRSQNVLALDLSPEMVRVAREHSSEFPNIEFQFADIMIWNSPAAHFDCIATIATLHHLPLREILLRMKAALKPGGVLLVLDLFEPGRLWHGHPARDFGSVPEAVRDTFLNALAMAVSGILRLIHEGRLKPPREVRDAWAEHGEHDSYPTIREVRNLCADILPGAKVKKHLLWRYSIVYQKPDPGPQTGSLAGGGGEGGR
jgi:SAM-dependent methyltransferase